RIRPDESEQDLDDAGLAGSVRSQQAVHLAAADGEGHAVDGGLPAIPFAQVRAPDRGCGGQIGEQLLRAVQRGTGGHRDPSPRATDSTSSGLSEPATAVTTP